MALQTAENYFPSLKNHIALNEQGFSVFAGCKNCWFIGCCAANTAPGNLREVQVALNPALIG